MTNLKNPIRLPFRLQYDHFSILVRFETWLRTTLTVSGQQDLLFLSVNKCKFHCMDLKITQNLTSKGIWIGQINIAIPLIMNTFCAWPPEQVVPVHVLLLS